MHSQTSEKCTQDNAIYFEGEGGTSTRGDSHARSHWGRSATAHLPDLDPAAILWLQTIVVHELRALPASVSCDALVYKKTIYMHYCQRKLLYDAWKSRREYTYATFSHLR